MASNNPLVSIVIPIYNNQKTLDRCLTSAMQQTYENIEIIVVNDGSTDHSPEIVKRISKNDSRIKVVDKVQNEGLVLARKTGIEHSQGKYIQYLDGDDVLCQKAIEFLVKRAEETQADVVVAPFLFVINGEFEKSMALNFDLMTGKEYLRSILNLQAYWCVWSKFHLRSLYETSIERPKASFGEDVVLSTQLLLKANKVVSVDYEIIHYYFTPQSMSHPNTFNESKYEDFKTYVSWFIAYMQRSGLEFELKKELALFHLKNVMLRMHWKKISDFHQEMKSVIPSLIEFPNLVNSLSRRERKIVKSYQRAYWLGYVNVMRYKFQGKI